jgi:sugar lactone lactonase YvrE
LYAFSFAHDVRVDKDDNIWAVDKGSDMVVKFSPEGRVLMVFGRKKEAADVTWNAQGDIFISDGYVNSRVAKYDKNGDWVKSFGEPGSGPGQLNTPHGIAADANGNIYVANRGNSRIEVFDSNGQYIRQIKINLPLPADAKPAIGNTPNPETGPGTQSPGAPWTVCITPGPNQVLYTSDAYPGRIYKMDLNGNILGVLGKSGKQLKQFGWIHQIACPSENELYVAEVLNWRVQKLLLHPVKNVQTATR